MRSSTWYDQRHDMLVLGSIIIGSQAEHTYNHIAAGLTHDYLVRIEVEAHCKLFMTTVGMEGSWSKPRGTMGTGLLLTEGAPGIEIQ